VPIGDDYIEEVATLSNATVTGKQPKKWIVGDDSVNVKELKHIHT
jgi:hypothetical protein